MDQLLGVQNKSKGKKSSLFFKQITIEEAKIQSEVNDAQDQIGDSNHHFKNKNCEPQKLHQGDQDVSLSSFLVGMNEFLQESQKDIKTTNQSFCKAQQEEPLMQIIGQSSNKFLGQTKHNLVLESEIKANLKINEDIEQENQESQIIEESFNKSNTKDSQSFQDQIQSKILFSKNKIAKNDTKNKISQNSSQCRSISHSRMKINSHVLVQDDIFFEKDNKKLETKVNLVLKSQYQLNQEHNTNSIYKQNLQRAAKIIKMLFSSSINRVLRIRQNVSNFINFLKLRHSNRRLENLTQQEYCSINDLSHFYSSRRSIQKGQNCLKIMNYLFSFTKLFPVFMPSNTIRVIWDIIQVAFTYFFLYIYSLLIFFDQNYFDQYFIQKFYLIAFSVFLSDIIITFNTAFYDQDIIITKHKIIAKRYLFSSVFVTDFICVLLLGYKAIYSDNFVIFYLNRSTSLAVNMLNFLKANGISIKKKRFDCIFTFTENQKLVCKLINQLASVITAAHIAALGWHFVGVQEDNNNQQNWLEKIGVKYLSIQGQYIYSIYWAITTMTTGKSIKFSKQPEIYLNQEIFYELTVGYGDITATNSIEALYISITMILFSCVFAYSINNIGFILQEIEKSSKQLNDDLSTIQRYLIRKNVGIQLKSRVRHYLSFLAQEQKDRDKRQEDKILHQLSNKLRDEITLEINSKILNSYHLFSSNFSKSTLNKLLFIMKEILVNPNEIIISEYQQDDSSIYFIQNGIIEIYQQQIQKQGQINIIQTLTDGQIFGDISFFTGLKRQSSARSVNLSTLYKISRDQFIEVLKENKEDFEYFKMMQDQIIFQKEKFLINNSCYYCKDSYHIANECPRTHKIIDKQFIILKHNFTKFQERFKQERSKRKQKLNAKLEIKRNSAILQRLKYNYCYSDEQQFFFNDENLQSSYDTMTQNSNYENDENTHSNVFDQQQEKDSIKKKSIKAQERDKIAKSSKSILDKQNQSHYDEADQQINQENQIEGCHSNLIYEQQDAHKIVWKSFSSQAKLKSFDGLEAIEFNNQDSLKNILHRQKSQQESNKVIQTKEIENYQNLKSEQQFQYANNQSEKEGSNYNNSRIFEKQRILQQNQLPITIQLGDQQKNQIIKRSYSNKQFVKQTSSYSEEEQDSSYNYDNSQNQQNNKLESNKKASTSNHITSHSKINSFQKSQKLLNQNHQERKSSIDCAFQNIATFLYLQGINVSSRQLNSGNNFYQDNSANNSLTSKKIKDQKESRSSSTTQKKTKSSKNSNNLQESSQEKYKTEQLSKISQQQPSQKDLQVINTLTKILQNSQIPLLLQLASAKSFQNLESQNLHNNPMDYFDRMQFYKKYYPEYNIQNVMHKLKILQQQQKKLKKAKLAQRERRQNIGATKISIFQENSKVIKIVPQQDYNINKYKPTNLSYGVKMQNGTIYPKFSFSQQNN